MALSLFKSNYSLLFLFVIGLGLFAHHINNDCKKTFHFISSDKSMGILQTGHKKDYEKFMSNFDSDIYEITLLEIDTNSHYYVVEYRKKEKQSKI